MNVQGMSYLFPGYESTTRYYYTVYACAELQFMRVAENAIRTTEMRERRMIVSRTGLIRIWYRPWLFNYAWTVYGYDGEQLIDAAYHSTNSPTQFLAFDRQHLFDRDETFDGPCAVSALAI